MKLKNFIGLCITCFAVASMATIAHAEHYAIGGANGQVDAVGKTSVEVPVMVIPDENEKASVNGYIMSFTYDSSEAAPAENKEDLNSPYATKGDNFSDGIMISSIVDSKDPNQGDKTLIVAWASATPVEIDSATATSDQETMAKIPFNIIDNKVNDIPIHVEVAQLAKDDTTVKTEEEVAGQVVQGDLDLTDLLIGDADNNNVVDILDAATVRDYTIGSKNESEIDMRNANADKNSGVDILDAATIRDYTIGLKDTL